MIKNKIFSFYALIFLLSLSADLLANSMTQLYHGRLIVNDQSTLSRNNAIESLFQKTLIKVSGKSDIGQHPVVKDNIKKALSYTTQFSFNEDQGNLYIDVVFNESLIDQLLRKNGITLWDSRRPTAMLWLVYEDAHGVRQLVNSQVTDELFIEAKKVAEERGLPLLLPLWDLDDQIEVSISDVWGQFEDKVALANARYISDYMILAKVTQQGFSQQVSWNIYKMSQVVDVFGQTSSQIKSVGNEDVSTLKEAVHQIISQSTQYFASQYSVDTSKDTDDLYITINNIDTLKKYVDVVKYLKSIKAVDQLTLINNKIQEYRFKVKLIGNEQSLIEAIELGNKMNKITNYDPELILFQWRG